jgi:RNA polymerase sigma-70 factor, ECF subfamily
MNGRQENRRGSCERCGSSDGYRWPAGGSPLLAGLPRPRTAGSLTVFFGTQRDNFEAMVHAHSADLYRFAYWLCRNRAVAEDLVQETYARAWTSWRDVRDERAAKGWLLTILHHEHARMFEKKRPEIDERDLDEIVVEADSSVEEAIELRDALWSIPIHYREPLLLQVLGGFTGAEIARALDVSEATVMQRVSRARKLLRRLLAPAAVRKEGSR